MDDLTTKICELHRSIVSSRQVYPFASLMAFNTAGVPSPSAGAHTEGSGDRAEEWTPPPSGSPIQNSSGRPAGSGGGSSGLAGAGSRSQPKSRSGASTVSWKDLPRKEQLIVITLTRLSEPLVQSSIQSYMFYQLKWFDPTLPDSAISAQAGVLQCVLPCYCSLTMKPDEAGCNDTTLANTRTF